jgi:hypothetical protein
LRSLRAQVYCDHEATDCSELCLTEAPPTQVEFFADL